MAYQIRFKPSALKSLERLPSEDRERVRRRIHLLADNPRPHGVTKMHGEENAYRIRIGKYRVIYEIQERVLIVLVAVIAHRREAYR